MTLCVCVGLSMPIATFAQADFPRPSPWILTTLSDISPVAIHHDGSLDVPFTLALVTFDALQVADLVLTRRALRDGLGTEGNPIMRPFLENPPADIAIKLVGAGATNWCLKEIWEKNKAFGWISWGVLTVLQGYVTHQNYRIAVRLRL